jgi:hypothetical protein
MRYLNVFFAIAAVMAVVFGVIDPHHGVATLPILFAGPILQKLPPFENVAASSTAVLPRIPQGDTFDALLFDASGSGALTVANMDDVRVRLGGKRIWDIDYGAHYDLIAQYNGFNATAAQGMIWLFFADPQARTIVGQRLGALATQGGYSDFAVEFDIGTATTPSLVPYALKSAPKINAASMFRAILKATHTPSAAAVNTLPVPLGSNVGNLIRAVHFISASAEAVTLGVRKDGVFLLEDVPQDVLDTLTTIPANSKVAQTLHAPFDALVYNDQGDAVPTLRPDKTPAHFEFRYETSTGDTIYSYSDLYTEIDRI